MIVNGKELSIDDLKTESPVALIEHFELDPRAVALERNGAILPRSEWDRQRLADADRIEIIRFVGGG
ncbi:MAG: sulfur carrier protein ThiS [bacterium]|nr:sulfur carrier protein ThiS [bacterium]